jgi:hypothetical protein
MGVRWYYPKVGRFLSSDPVAGTANPRVPIQGQRWLYGADSPLLYLDPTGLMTLANDSSAICDQVCQDANARVAAAAKQNQQQAQANCAWYDGICQATQAWNSAKKWVGDKVEGAKQSVSDQAGRAEQWVSDQAGRAKQWVSDQASGVKQWVTTQADRYKRWVRDNADDIRLFSATASIVSGVASTVSLLCGECAVIAEPLSFISAIGATWADASLAYAGKGDLSDVGLDVLGLVPGLGLLRADAKIAKFAKIYSSLDKRTKGARALKGVIQNWNAAKKALQGLDFVEALRDFARGGGDVINRFAPSNAPSFPTWRSPVRTRADGSSI